MKSNPIALKQLWSRALGASLLCLALALAGCASGASSASSTSSGSSAASSEDAFASNALADAVASSSSSQSSSSSAAKGDPKLAAQIKEEVQRALEPVGMDVGVSVVDLKTGTSASVNGSEQFASASMIKLIVAYAFLEQVDAGKYSLEDEYTLKDSDIVGGTGSLGGLGAGAPVTYHELVEKMISISDNTAANVLIETVGMDAINAKAKELKLSKTEVNRLMMDEEAIASGIENYTSADDFAMLLQLAYENKFVSKDASELVMEALEEQEDDDGISDGLPNDVVFAHKTGSLANVHHDGGIVETDNPYILVVLCGGDGYSLDGALEAMANVAQVTWSILGTDSGTAANSDATATPDEMSPADEALE